MGGLILHEITSTQLHRYGNVLDNDDGGKNKKRKAKDFPAGESASKKASGSSDAVTDFYGGDSMVVDY